MQLIYTSDLHIKEKYKIKVYLEKITFLKTSLH